MFDACVPSAGGGGGVPQFGNEKGGGTTTSIGFSPASHSPTVSPQVNTLLLKKKNKGKKLKLPSR